MPTRVAINGFGRIGRQAFKIASRRPELEIVAINDIGDTENMAYLLRHDTVYRQDEQQIETDGDKLIVDGNHFPVLKVTDPSNLPWRELQVDVVIESTGRFTKREQALEHLEAGAKRVVISAPAKGAPSFVLGVNEESFNPEEDTVISNASCTTNSITPVMAILDEKFGVAKALLTTVHSYTSDQRLVDSPHKDWRRGRSAAQNIVPTSTGAAQAAAEALPQLKGIFDGMSLRVPTIDVSLSDITVLLRTKTTREEINQAFVDASQTERFRGILTVANEPLVSADFIGNPSSSIVDLELTQVIDGDFVKVFAWYDNEWGYSNRLVEQVVMVGNGLTREAATATA
jgi:glyceraldehyde 3-phosphate dehydrogenase